MSSNTSMLQSTFEIAELLTKHIERLIARTPTSENRNKLTDAQIYIQAAYTNLVQVYNSKG
jgi:hypothetical protein